MTTLLKERILKEFKNLIGYLSHYEDEEVEFVSKALDSYRLETIKEVEEGFIGEFCNDHNAKIRWLRGVALDMNDLLEQILDYLAHLKGGEKK